MSDFTENKNEMIDKLSGKAKIEWQIGKEEAWNKIQSRLNEAPRAKAIAFSYTRVYYMAAAAIVVMLGISAVLQFYTKTWHTLGGQQMVVLLPDGSKITMHAGSEVVYKPWQWYFSRDVKLTGEAYFEVQKGSVFSVITPNGNTRVLGTRFSVYSRKTEYSVVCYHGSVAVSSKQTSDELILKPGQRASLKNGSLLLKNAEDVHEDSPAWLNNNFSFREDDIYKVFQEVSLSYGIDIQVDSGLDVKYTGNFQKSENPETVLGNICLPLGLKYELKSDDVYVVSKAE